MPVRRLSTSAYKLLAIIAGGLLYGAAQATTAPHSNGQIIAAESVDAGDYYLGLDGQPIRFHRKKDVYLKLDSIASARKLKREQFKTGIASTDIAQAARAFAPAATGFSRINNHRWNGLEIVKRNPGLQSMAARGSAALDNRETEYAPVFTSESGRGEYLILPDIMISFNSLADVQQYKWAMLEQFGMKIKNQMMFSETDFVLAFETGVDDYSKVFRTTRDLMALPYIKWAEPNMQVKLQRTDTPNPNDYLYREQWGLENWGDDGALCIEDTIGPGSGYAADIDANDAWDYMDGLGVSSIPVIAILDDGVQLDHPDLPIVSKAVSDGNFGGSGSNVCFDDPHGCNFGDFYNWGGGIGRTYNRSGPDVFSAQDGTIVPPAPQTASDTHGTLVAGIAAAKRNNTIGIAGSAFNAEILSVRLDFNTTMDCESLVDAMSYADHYADIISNSWRLDSGAQGLCQSSLDSKITAIAATGTPILFASGNSAAGWRKITLELSASDAVIQFAFHKDDSFFPTDIAEDAVWIDNIKLPDTTLENFESAGWPMGYSLKESSNSPIPPTGIVTDYNACSGGSAIDAKNSEHAILGSGSAIKLSTTKGNCSYLTITRSTLTAGTMSFWVWVSAEPWILQDSPTKLIGDPFRIYVDGMKTTIDLINAAEDGVDKSHNSLNEQFIYDGDIEYPALHVDVIAVGASNDGSDAYGATAAEEDEDRAYFSQYSSGLNVLAPGINIRTTAVNGSYGSLSGTSASTPMVAGVIANMLAITPGLSLENIKTYLHDGADKIGPQIGEFAYDMNGHNDYYGYGRVNAHKSAQLASTGTITDEAPELCTDPNPGAADDDWLLLTMPAILAAALKNK